MRAVLIRLIALIALIASWSVGCSSGTTTPLAPVPLDSSDAGPKLDARRPGPSDEPEPEPAQPTNDAAVPDVAVDDATTDAADATSVISPDAGDPGDPGVEVDCRSMMFEQQEGVFDCCTLAGPDCVEPGVACDGGEFILPGDVCSGTGDNDQPPFVCWRCQEL